ncbi:MAG: hypothetical protein ACE5IP_04590 [Terriglobia bacterium]
MAEAARPLSGNAEGLQAYAPTLDLARLVPGTDNIRYDVYLSPSWRELANQVLFEQILHRGQTQLREIYPEDSRARVANFREFTHRLSKLLLEALAYAKDQNNIEIDLLARVALYRWLVAEMRQQFTNVTVACKERIDQRATYHAHDSMWAFSLRSKLSDFQAHRRHILRALGEMLSDVFVELEEKTLRPEQVALFGVEFLDLYGVLRNRLVLLENPYDSVTHIEHYIMLGHRDGDADHENLLQDILAEMLRDQGFLVEESKELASVEQHRKGLMGDLEEVNRRLREQEARLDDRVPLGQGKWLSLKWVEKWRSRKTDPKTAQKEVNALRIRHHRLSQDVEEVERKAEFVRQAYASRLQEILSQPANAALLFGPPAVEGETQERTPEQKGHLRELFELLKSKHLVKYLVACYVLKEAYKDFCPPLNPQQLKRALVDREGWKELEALVDNFPTRDFPLEKLHFLARQLRRVRYEHAEPFLVQFTHDFMRFRRDFLHLQLLNASMEKIHLIEDERSLQISRLNHSLYAFLLAEEHEKAEERILNHVIVKADIRGSTHITHQLVERGLNPATHFSLNFFDPVQRLMASHDAVKIFVEGDALILGLFEADSTRSGQRAVAKACILAKEIVQLAEVYNKRAAANGLPRLELGLGVATQSGSPHYLMDGEARVMISPAINLSDRLSSSSKIARALVREEDSDFNCFVFQGPPNLYTGADKEGRLIRYNVMGVTLDEAGFQKLQHEISLQSAVRKVSLLGQTREERFYWGTVPIGGRFEKLLVRQARIAEISLPEGAITGWTDESYYEVCVNPELYEDFPGPTRSRARS